MATMRFRAHETFFIRKGWLSKGMEQIVKKPDLFIDKDENPMDVLGIGSNMVKALRYWLQAVELTKEKGIVKSIDAKYIVIEFPDQEKKLGLPIAVAKGIISIDTDDFRMKHMKYVPVLERADSISRAVERAKNALKGYEDYLD